MDVGKIAFFERNRPLSQDHGYYGSPTGSHSYPINPISSDDTEWPWKAGREGLHFQDDIRTHAWTTK